MFRTPYVYHQEDYIVHSALYGMFFMHLCKQSSTLEDPPGMFLMHLCKLSILKSAFCWLTLHNCITMQGTKNIKMGTYYLYWN